MAVIEWADKFDASLPVERLEVTIAHQTEETRLITITPRGARYRELPRQWQTQPTARGKTCGQEVTMREMASA